MITLEQLDNLIAQDKEFEGYLSLEKPSLPDLPFYLRGPASKPLVILIGGQHGNEPAGVAVVSRLAERLESINSSLNVRVLGLPLLNVLAFKEGNRCWSGDHLDMNRMFFSENESTGPTAEIASMLFSMFIRLKPILVIDVHAGGAHNILLHVRTHLNEASDYWSHIPVNWVQRFDLPKGFIIRALNEQNIPAFSLETGGSKFDINEIECTVKAVLSLFINKGMLIGKVVPIESVELKKTLKREASNTSGYFYATTNLGEKVNKHTELGFIIDLLSGYKSSVKTQQKGYLSALLLHGPISKGEIIFELLCRDDNDYFIDKWSDKTHLYR